MSTFTPILKQMMVDGILQTRAAIPKVNTAGIVLVTLSAVLAVFGAGFLFLWEYFYLTQTYTQDTAAIFVAGTALLIACLSALAGKGLFKREGFLTSRHEASPDLAKSVSRLVDSLAEELEEPIRENPKTALMIASLAGFLAGDQRH